jgi:hypothetical protein
LERARLRGANPWPLTDLHRTKEHDAAVSKYIQDDHNYFALRVNSEDLESDTLSARVLDLIKNLKTSPEKGILYFDLGEVRDVDLTLFAKAIAHHIETFPYIHRYAKFFVSAGSFPERLRIPKGEVREIARDDWRLYQGLIAIKSQLAREPAFSDFGAEKVHFPPPAGRVSVNIHLRYTTPKFYVVSKGDGAEGYQGIYKAAENIRAREDFDKTGSFGDSFIAACGVTSKKTGNATTWREVAATRHFHVVLQELAPVPTPSLVPGYRQDSFSFVGGGTGKG